MYFKFFGRAATSSSSIKPVIATDWNVLYATLTPSKAPDLHSSMNSSRERDLGSMTSAIENNEDHASWALYRKVCVSSVILGGQEWRQC